MERETREIITPLGKNKIKIKTWLTGFEKRAIQSVFLDNVNLDVKNGDSQVNNIKGDVVTKAQDKTIEVCVDSVDDNKDNVLEAVGNLHSDDFDFVVEELNKLQGDAVVGGKKKEK